MPRSDVQEDAVSADAGGLFISQAPGGLCLQQAADILVRAVKEAQRCEGILRSHVVNLEAELEAARKEASEFSRIAEETKAENQQLKVKTESLGKLVAKQQQVIAEHEGRLRAFSARTIGAMLARKHGGVKRRRVTDHEDLPTKEQNKVEEAEFKAAKGIVMENKTKAGKAALAPFKSLPTASEIPPRSQRSELQDQDAKPSCGKSAILESDESETSNRHSGKFQESKGTGSKDAESQREETQGMSSDTLKIAKVAGLRIWEPREPSRKKIAPKEREPNGLQNPNKLEEEQFDRSRYEKPKKAEKAKFEKQVPLELAQIVQTPQVPPVPPVPPAPSPVAFTRAESGCFDRVRAEGQSALTSKVNVGVPCRCVVRGKAQRSALQGFDCEQCRNFYTATKLTKLPGPKPDDLKASRHRSDHAPTCTPPGFWDLSFPHRDVLPGS